MKRFEEWVMVVASWVMLLGNAPAAERVMTPKQIALEPALFAGGIFMLSDGTRVEKGLLLLSGQTRDTLEEILRKIPLDRLKRPPKSKVVVRSAGNWLGIVTNVHDTEPVLEIFNFSIIVWPDGRSHTLSPEATEKLKRLLLECFGLA